MRRRGTVLSARPLSIWSAALCGVVVYALAGLGIAVADSCPNAGIRAIQGVTDLAECRAFEQVTPVEKNEANVSLGKPAQSAVQPGAVAFTTSTGLPGGQTNLSIGYYRAKRGPDGWSTSFYDLPQENQGTSVVQATRIISPDVSRSVSATQSPLFGIEPGGAAVFIHDLDTGGTSLVAEDPSNVRTEPNWLYNSFMDVFRGPVAGATSDFSKLIFETTSPLLGGAPKPESWEWDEGTLRPLGILPNGDTAPAGASLFEGSQSAAAQNPTWLSADGSRVFFTAPAAPTIHQGGLYVRENGTSTRLISYSQRTGDDPGLPVEVEFVTSSVNGRYAFFQARIPLTDDSTGSGCWMYRYDLDTDQLIRLAGTGEGLFAASCMWVQRVSGDGERVYFTTQEAQLAGAPEGVYGLYIWDHGQTRLIAESSPSSPTPSSFAMSDDGRYMEFATRLSPTGYPPNPPTSSACPDEGKPGPCPEMYAYDAVTEALVCLSCGSQGTVSGGDATAGVPAKGGVYTPRAVLNDGTYLFDTPTALVPQDVNRKRDVYEWKDDTLSLISSGVDRNDARYLDASADGTDVYFATAGRLVAQDRDDLRDIYTARRDGGMASQNVAQGESESCSQEACQGGEATPASPPAIGSGVISGAPVSPSRRGASHARGAKLSVRSRASSAAVASLAVTVSGPGRIRVSGRGIVAAEKNVRGGGTKTIRVRLTPAARSAKAKKAKVRVTFIPRQGKPTSRQLRVSFGAKGGSR